MPHFKSADFAMHILSHTHTTPMHYYTSPLRPGVSEFRSIRGTDSGREPSAITESLQRQPWSIVDDRWSLHEWNQIALGYFFQMSLHYSSKLHSIFHPFSSGISSLSEALLLQPSGIHQEMPRLVSWALDVSLVEISCSMILDTFGAFWTPCTGSNFPLSRCQQMLADASRKFVWLLERRSLETHQMMVSEVSITLSKDNFADSESFSSWK